LKAQRSQANPTTAADADTVLERFRANKRKPLREYDDTICESQEQSASSSSSSSSSSVELEDGGKERLPKKSKQAADLNLLAKDASTEGAFRAEDISAEPDLPLMGLPKVDPNVKKINSKVQFILC
jgi:hypothetical protein